MESGVTKLPEPPASEPKSYEPPVVVATYSVEELRRAAAVAGASHVQ